MAVGPQQDGEKYEVQDDGDVDTKIKRRIIDARNRVDETEEYLYVKAPVEDDLNANSVQQDMYYGMMVKQFLRTIEPLLLRDEMPENTEYYEGVELGSVQLVPRNTEGVPFEEYVRADLSPVQFKLRHDLADDADLPEPAEVAFVGLKAVIETNGVVSRTWNVPAGGGGVIRTGDEQAVPKEIYEKALRSADEFLDQAGLGIDIEAEPYTGDDGPGL